MNQPATVNTTLGNLIAALTDEAAQYVTDENEVYQIVSFMLGYLLNNSRVNSRRCH